MRRSPTITAALGVVLLIAGCQTGGPPEDMPDGMAGDGMEGMDGDGMDAEGMEGMGRGADITVAAGARVASLPAEARGWVGYRAEGVDATDEPRSWGPVFLYTDEQDRTVEVGGAEVTLGPGEAVFVDEGTDHTVPDGTFWAFLLTDPEAAPPAGLEEATQEWSSGPLEGLPDGEADVRFLIVDLPPQGGQTTVHTHPGPEYIAVVEGDIEYETGLEEATVLTDGDEAALPRDTPVQKRNPSDEPARFWSWFIVDPDQPFAAEAAFDRR